MATPAENVLQQARSQVGVKESPSFSNRQPYGAFFNHDGVEWCALFVSWCFVKAAVPLPTINLQQAFAACDDGLAYAHNHGELVGTAIPGDIVFFRFPGSTNVGPDHVGLLESDNGDGTITTIDGNTGLEGGGSVARARRAKQWAVGVWRPVALGGGGNGGGGAIPAPEPSLGGASAGMHPSVARLPSAIIGPNATGEPVRAIQRFLGLVSRLLADPTLDPGSVDGGYGPQVTAAVRAWQARIGAGVDGGWGPDTLLRSSAFVRQLVPEVVRQIGDADPVVIAIQRFLHRVAEWLADPDLDPQGIDGGYGTNTAEAVEELQGLAGAGVDGVWGPGTVASATTFLLSLVR